MFPDNAALDRWMRAALFTWGRIRWNEKADWADWMNAQSSQQLLSVYWAHRPDPLIHSLRSQGARSSLPSEPR